MSRPDYALLGPFARADVTHANGCATLVGHLAGELVARAFGPDETDAYVFDVAKSLAFEGRWPVPQRAQTGDTLDMLEAVHG